MKLPENRTFCFWVLPSKDGKIKKLRLSTRGLLFISIIIVLLWGAFVMGATDYAKLQYLRAKNYLVIRKLVEEKSALKDEKETLEGQLEALQSEYSKAINSQGNVKEKLKELSSIIKSASALGVLPSKEKKGIVSKKVPEAKSAGIGGKEVDCRDSNGTKCSFLLLGDEAISNKNSSSKGTKKDVKFDAKSLDDLVQDLDYYITTLKKVPLGIPARGEVSSKYGIRLSPFNGEIKKHEGLDISQPYGAKVFVTGDGVVTDVDYRGEYGLLIEVKHNGSVLTRYAHLSKALVKKGQKVTRGTLIGLVGASGMVTGPHLHYEVRINGRATDPSTVMALAKKLQRAIG